MTEPTGPPAGEAQSFNSPDPLAAFVRQAVEGFLDAQDVAHELDDDGDIAYTLKQRPANRSLRVVVQLPFDEELGPVLQVECWADLELDETRASTAASACADWNRDEWWPKAYVDRPAEADPPGIVLEYTLPIGRSLSQALVEEFLAAFNSGAVSFWNRIDEDHAELLRAPAG